MNDAIMDETNIKTVKYLQWLMEGKTQGSVVEITGEEKDGNDTYYTLSDGTRVNVDVVGSDIIKEVYSPAAEHLYNFKRIVHKPAPMKEEKGADGELYFVPNDSLTPKERNGWVEVKITPPQQTPTQQASKIPSDAEITMPRVKPITMNDPFIAMMDSISLETHSLQIDIDSEMLPRDFFDMNSKYMEGGESKMINFIVDKIMNNDKLKLMIKESVKSFYVKKDEND